MGHFRAGFLLVELLVLILLVTLLITLFLGGQARLLADQAAGVKKLRELNMLINESERIRGKMAGSAPSLQVEKFVPTRPVITTAGKAPEKWVPQLTCYVLAAHEAGKKEQTVWLPRVGRTGE